jgi:Domain of unknown function (DUF4388)
MSIALHGNLRDFGIAEVFQLIGQQRKTGTLVVGEGAEAVALVFDEGRVVCGGAASQATPGESLGRQLVRCGHLTRDRLESLIRESARSARPVADLLRASGQIAPAVLAEIQDLLTRETVFDIMRRKSGEFHFSAEAVEHDTPPERLLGAEQILMDGLRMLDEWQTFAAAVPSEELVFRRVGDLESSRVWARTGGEERTESIERVLKLIDGRLNVRRVIDLSRIGTFEATRVLADLRQAGLIEPCAEEPRRVPKPAASPRSILPGVRTLAASVVPFVLLIWLGAIALGHGAATPAPSGTPLPDRFMARVGVAQEADLLRELVQLHFFETGSYPASLEEMAERAAEAGRSLTPTRLAAYHYAVRGDDVVLLPPMN